MLLEIYALLPFNMFILKVCIENYVTVGKIQNLDQNLKT